VLSVAFFNCYAKCRHAECCYAECCYAECRYAECRYAECRYAECCYAECRYAECHYALFPFSAIIRVHGKIELAAFGKYALELKSWRRQMFSFSRRFDSFNMFLLDSKMDYKSIYWIIEKVLLH
jgi:hypothetical protein